MKINYFNFKDLHDGRILLTNDAGYYYKLEQRDFLKIIEEDFDELEDKVIEDLKERFFLFDENEKVFIERAALAYRDNKNYALYGTSLHIFVMTNACNMNCVYCQAQDSAQTNKGKMSLETAERAVEVALQSPVHHVTFEFQGGEPLTNFDAIKHIILYSEERSNDKEIDYSVVTNTLLINDEMISFFKDHNVSISTSLDGDKITHNNNRKTITGKDTFDTVVENIGRIRQAGIPVGAIQTTTKNSLAHANDIVSTYTSLGLKCLFVRPLTPLGYANEHWDEIGYTTEEFLEFYEKVLTEVLEYNRKGCFLTEGHASIFLQKILGHYSGNYMELRSPCGAATGQMAYYYDGNIYTCDEARMLSEMGDSTFRLGNVYEDDYNSITESRVCKITCKASVLEGLPGCCDCVYSPYCGVCPVVNLTLEGNIYARSANNYRCRIYKGMLDILFKHLDNEEDLEVFKTWI